MIKKKKTEKRRKRKACWGWSGRASWQQPASAPQFGGLDWFCFVFATLGLLGWTQHSFLFLYQEGKCLSVQHFWSQLLQTRQLDFHSPLIVKRRPSCESRLRSIKMSICVLPACLQLHTQRPRDDVNTQKRARGGTETTTKPSWWRYLLIFSALLTPILIGWDEQNSGNTFVYCILPRNCRWKAACG